MNRLYYGDNLVVLRDRKNFPDECVDLIYLDPPFNSKRDYNLLFKSPKIVGQAHRLPGDLAGEAPALQNYSAAQIEAFEDTWHWTQDVTEREYDEVLTQANTDVGKMMKSLVEFLGRNDRGGGGDSWRLVGGRATAYLVMMANRLLEQVQEILTQSTYR